MPFKKHILEEHLNSTFFVKVILKAELKFTAKLPPQTGHSYSLSQT